MRFIAITQDHRMLRIVLHCSSEGRWYAQAVSEAAAKHAKARGGETRPMGSLNKVPLDVSDGEVIRQQAYHALAVHSMAEQIRRLTGVVVTEKTALLGMAREG